MEPDKLKQASASTKKTWESVQLAFPALKKPSVQIGLIAAGVTSVLLIASVIAFKDEIVQKTQSLWTQKQVEELKNPNSLSQNSYSEYSREGDVEDVADKKGQPASPVVVHNLPEWTLPRDKNSISEQCNQPIINSRFPFVTKSSLREQLGMYCFNSFITYYNTKTNTSWLALELLTPANLSIAYQSAKSDLPFTTEPRILDESPPGVNGYENTPYSKGQLIAAGNQTNQKNRADTFSMINVAPINSRLNEDRWAKLIGALRMYSVNKGLDIYVATGLGYFDNNPYTLQNGQVIPSAFYKAIYVPAASLAGVIWIDNTDAQKITYMTLKELNTQMGIDVFPTISDTMKNMDARSVFAYIVPEWQEAR